MEFTTMSSSIGIEAGAVIAGAFLSGAMMSLFLLTIPVLTETSLSASQLLHQWNRVFFRGHIQGPIISIATGSVHGYTAWSRAASGSHAWRIFAVAGALTVSMIPFTWLAMRGINNKLHQAVQWTDEAKEAGREQAESLVNKWSRFNAVRALFPLSGAVLGLLGVCNVLAF